MSDRPLHGDKPFRVAGMLVEGSQTSCLIWPAGCSLHAVFRKLGLVFAALALFSIAGGHWAVLQSVAWAEMLHDYTQRTGSIAVAVEQTFDGQHPCELCQQIQVAKFKEHKEVPAAPAKKDDAKVKALLADLFLCPFVPTVQAAIIPRAVSACGPSRTEQPPTPPPRRGPFAA